MLLFSLPDRFDLTRFCTTRLSVMTRENIRQYHTSTRRLGKTARVVYVSVLLVAVAEGRMLLVAM
jgi:hypothetical protein